MAQSTAGTTSVPYTSARQQRRKARNFIPFTPIGDVWTGKAPVLHFFPQLIIGETPMLFGAKRVALLFCLYCSAAILAESSSLLPTSTDTPSAQPSPQDAESQFQLAERYSSKTNGEQNLVEAFKCYLYAASMGHAAAQFAVAEMYGAGLVVKPNQFEELQWYQRAAESGHASAQWRLAEFYDYGLGTTEQSAESLRWYRSAAELGHAGAQFRLAEMYQNGQGLSKDLKAALSWYQKAAQAGHSQAAMQAKILSAASSGEKKPVDTKLP